MSGPTDDPMAVMPIFIVLRMYPALSVCIVRSQRDFLAD